MPRGGHVVCLQAISCPYFALKWIKAVSSQPKAVLSGVFCLFSLLRRQTSYAYAELIEQNGLIFSHMADGGSRAQISLLEFGISTSSAAVGLQKSSKVTRIETPQTAGAHLCIRPSPPPRSTRTALSLTRALSAPSARPIAALHAV